jgi:hypothetical protein
MATGIDVDHLGLGPGTEHIGSVGIDSATSLTVDGVVVVSGTFITPDANLTQLVTVTTSGVPVQGPNVDSTKEGWVLKANPTNSGNVWYMYHGQTKTLKGFPLSVGEAMYVPIKNLSSLDFDSDYSSGKIHATMQ